MEARSARDKRLPHDLITQRHRERGGILNYRGIDRIGIAGERGEEDERQREKNQSQGRAHKKVYRPGYGGGMPPGATTGN